MQIHESESDVPNTKTESLIAILHLIPNLFLKHLPWSGVAKIEN